MSIASEIERLQTTKAALKQALIDAGNVIADSDTIDTYVVPVSAGLAADEALSKVLLGENSLSTVTTLKFSPAVNTATEGALNGVSNLVEIKLPFIGDQKNTRFDGLDHYPLGYIFGTTNYTGAKSVWQRYKNASDSLVGRTYYIPETLKKIAVDGASIIPTGAFSQLGLLLDKITISNSTEYVMEAAIGTDVKEIQLPYAGYTSYGTLRTYNNMEKQPFGYIFGDGSIYADMSKEAVRVNQHVTDRYGSTTAKNFNVPKSLKKVIMTGDCSGRPIAGSDRIMLQYGAFENMSMLEEVVLPETLKVIGCEAFVNCTSLKSINIPRDIEDIQLYNVTANTPSQPFSGCYELATITYSGTSDKYAVKNNCLYDNSMLSDYNYCKLITGTKNATIANDGINTSIAVKAFKDTKLSSKFVLPDNITKVENEAFYNASLVSLSVPSSLTTIGTDAFSGCFKLVEIYDQSSLGITAGSTDNGYIGYYAKNIYTPTSGQSKIFTVDGITYYIDGADKLVMAYDGNSATLTIPNDATEIYQYCCKNDVNLTSDSYNLTTLNTGDGITEIGAWAFANCKSLTTVNLGSNLTTIDVSAFRETGLTSINIPDNITTLGSYVFYNCKDLASAVVGTGISSIPEGTFYCNNSSYYYDGSLVSLTLKYPGVVSVGTSWTLPTSAQNLCTVYVPADQVANYEADTNWQSYINAGYITIAAIAE